MELNLKLKCAGCGGTFDLDSKTRRRVVYKCAQCGKELPIRKHPYKQQSVQEIEKNET